MPERSRDWFRQAQHDLEKAKLDRQWQYFEWACCTAPQAAEKAVKAVGDIVGMQDVGFIKTALAERTVLASRDECAT